MQIEDSHRNNLLPQIRLILDEPDLFRIASLREDKWITYTTAKEILEKLDDLLLVPKKTRMPSLLLVGDTNNGKTSILRRFISKNKPFEQGGQTRIPVIFVLAPPSPDLGGFYSKVLQTLSVPYRSTDKTSKKEELIRYYFSICDVKILIIDEIHNILSGAVAKQKSFMNALKNMSNELQIPIVLSGIAEALHATNTDTQISNRFKPIFLPKWKIDRDFLSLLASLEKLLPLRKASNLGKTKELAFIIADKSEGYIGEIVELVTLAAIYAINSGAEKITMLEVNKCGFIKPSLRKSYLELSNI